MARHQKDIVGYFPHDANACNSDTLTVLQSRFGNDGYAFWFKLLEKLSSTEGHYFDCHNSTKWQLLLAKAGVNELTGVEIMKLLVEMNAIDKELWESKVIWCQNLVDNIADVYKNRRRELPQKPLNTNKNDITTDDNAITTGDSTQSKVKQNKVNKTKEEGGDIALTNKKEQFNKFWEAYPKRKSKGDAERAFFKLNPNEQLLTTILSSIERAKKSKDWQKDSGEYIPYPATWLNNRGWEDEYLEEQEPEQEDDKPIKGLTIR